MRVLLVTANFRPRVGGIERFTEILAGGLARRGHEVTVLCCRYRKASESEELDGFSIVRLPAAYLLDRRLNIPYPLPSPMPLRRALRKSLLRADVVHTQDVLYATSVAALILARRLGVPSVVTQHVGFVPQGKRWADALQHAALLTLGRSMRLATRVVALNPAVARWAEERFRLENVDVVPVGVPRPGGARDRAELRRSFGLPPDRFIAVFVGRDVPKKGLDVFLAAGDRDYDLVAVTDRRTDAASVVVLPFQTPARIMDLLVCADAFVLPSEGEGFPMTLQEAFACGLPVVTVAQPGYDHFLTPNDVLFVERNPDAVRRALRRLKANDELRHALSARSLAVARQHFDEERFVTAYETIYARATTPTGSA